MALAFRPTHDPSIDTFRVEYLIGPSLILALLFNYSYSIIELFWSFSIFTESVAILPQLFILQRTGEAETITTHYLAALGAYRALYIPNWLYRFVVLGLLLGVDSSLSGLSGFTVTMSRISSTRSPSRQESCRQGSTSTSFMCTSPGTQICILAARRDHTLTHFRLQSTSGSEIRAPGMTCCVPTAITCLHLA